MEIEYVEPTPLNISTYTVLVNLKKDKNNLDQEIDLHLLSHFIPIYEENAVQTQDMDGCIIGINNYTEHTYTDIPRGKLNEKKRYPKSVFNNQLTIVYKYAGFKKINIKIFSNGKLHLTGINDYPWEVYHVSNFIIKIIKNINYMFYMSKNFSSLYNYAIYFDAPNKKLTYYRNDLDTYNIKNYIEAKKISEDKKVVEPTKKWLSANECQNIAKQYLDYCNKVMNDIKRLYNIIILNDTYSMNLREQLINELSVYKNLKPVRKKIMYFADKPLKINLHEHINHLIKIMKNYEKRINGLLETDSYIIDKLKQKYKNIVEKCSLYYDEMNCTQDKATSLTSLNSNDFIKEKMEMNSKVFAVNHIDVEFIKGEFNTGLGHRLIEMSEILKEKANIFNTYNPNHGHAGILVSFYFNKKYIDKGLQPGLCFCDDYCRNKDSSCKDKCICLTIVIFRPGNITITSAKTKEQLIFAYDFINNFIKNYKDKVCYQIDKKEIADSKLKKIIKRIPMYIKKEAIVYN